MPSVSIITHSEADTWTGSTAQMLECLTSTCKALNSNANTNKRKKEKEKEKSRH
jgi:hypothetical protein